MYKAYKTKNFLKSYKNLVKNKIFKVLEFEYVLEKLLLNIPLEAKYKDHKLNGEYLGYRECHIQNDILLIYSYENDILILTLIEIGSHSQLF